MSPTEVQTKGEAAGFPFVFYRSYEQRYANDALTKRHTVPADAYGGAYTMEAPPFNSTWIKSIKREEEHSSTKDILWCSFIARQALLTEYGRNELPLVCQIAADRFGPAGF